jgi:hypothetical protein
MTVGWDFTITNDTTGDIEITSAQYCRGPFNFPSSCEAPTAGTFTDFISAYNDIIVGPPGGTLPSTVSQAFNLALRSGIGSLAIDPGLPVPFTESGFIVLTYSVFDIDPNLPGAIQYGFDQVLSAEANISVQVQGSSQVPEPSTWMTVVVGGMAAFALRRRRIASGG